MLSPDIYTLIDKTSLRRLVSHKKVAFIAVGLIGIHAVIGFIGRFILNL